MAFKLVLATQNPGKLKELKEIAGNIDWLDLVLAPESFDPEETGTTFLANAQIKAEACAHITGCLSVADDSGISVAALDGGPGIYSARYCEGTDADRRTKLLQAVKEIPLAQRQAAFVCAMVLVDQNGKVIYSTEARWPGLIAFEERGTNGFGYDPIFYLPDYDKTSAELASDEKNQISHRGQAWRSVLEFLRKNYVQTSDSCANLK
jgi:XTP/dITP diphosphohydrolase